MKTGGLIYGTIRFTLAVPMARKSRKNVGLIGLGIIGSRVAVSLRAAGFNVFVWSRTPRAQPNFLGSPAELAEVASIIHLFVSDAAAVYEVIELFEDKLTPGHIIICNATIGPEATIEAARRIAETGAHFVDAPFTGSRDAAGAGELVYYLGGEDDILDSVEPVLKASSKALVRVGQIGQAATVKIATNMLVAVSTQALSECMAMMKSSGVNPLVLEEALEHHAVRSKLIDMKLPAMLVKDFDPHFSLRNLSKDVQIALALAKSGEIELPACSATATVLHKGLHRGWGDLDFSALIKAYDGEAASTPELTPPENREAEHEIIEVPPETNVGNAESDSAHGGTPVIDVTVEKTTSEATMPRTGDLQSETPSTGDAESDKPQVESSAISCDLGEEKSDVVPLPSETPDSEPLHEDRPRDEPAISAIETDHEKTPQPSPSHGVEKETMRVTSEKSGLFRRLFH